MERATRWSRVSNEAFKRKQKKKRLNFFFHDGKLHKTVRVARTRNEVYAWCFKDKREVMFVYSHILLHHEPAYTNIEVARLVNRSVKIVREHLMKGYIEVPEMAYSLSTGRPWMYFWTKEQVYRYHDFLVYELHRGRPRADGQVTPEWKTPCRPELRAKMEDNMTILAVNEETGETFPVFRETMWGSVGGIIMVWHYLVNLTQNFIWNWL